MLPRVFWATLHRVFASAMLSQEYFNFIELEFFMCNVAWSLLDNTARFYLMLSQEYQDSIEQDFPSALLSGDFWTTWQCFSVTLYNFVLRKLKQH